VGMVSVAVPRRMAERGVYNGVRAKFTGAFTANFTLPRSHHAACDSAAWHIAHYFTHRPQNAARLIGRDLLSLCATTYVQATALGSARGGVCAPCWPTACRTASTELVALAANSSRLSKL
jgi:hypothetical protein